MLVPELLDCAGDGHTQPKILMNGRDMHHQEGELEALLVDGVQLNLVTTRNGGT